MSKKAEPYDSTSPKQVKAAKRDAKILGNKLRNGLIKIMDDPDTRHLLATFLHEAKVFAPTFSPDPHQHAFNEGFRNSGLWWVTKLLLADPASIARLVTDQDSPMKVENNDDGRGTSSSTDDPDGYGDSGE